LETIVAEVVVAYEIHVSGLQHVTDRPVQGGCVPLVTQFVNGLVRHDRIKWPESEWPICVLAVALEKPDLRRSLPEPHTRQSMHRGGEIQQRQAQVRKRIQKVGCEESGTGAEVEHGEVVLPNAAELTTEHLEHLSTARSVLGRTLPFPRVERIVEID